MAFNPTIPGYSTQGKSFSRTAAFPLESYEIWDSAITGQSFDDLVAYAANTDASKDPSYIGQKVAYIDRTNNRVVHYGIEIDGTLKELGADKMGVEALTAADEGKIPQVFKVIDVEESGEEGSEDYQPEVSHIEIRWVEYKSTDYTVKITAREDVEGDDHSAYKHYVFEQCGSEIGHIDIPRDLVVKSGQVKEVTEANKPYSGAVVGDKYIDIEIANQEEHLYIPAKDLVEYITVEDTATVDLTLDADHKLTADVKISAEAGNSLVEKNDGLYVNAPDIPDIVIANSVDGTAPTETVTKVIASLASNEHTITPTVIEVATGKAVRYKYTHDKDTGWAVPSEESSTIENVLVPAVVTRGADGVATGGYAGLMTPEEKEKLESLVLGEGGNVEISGTINADNVIGLGTKISDVVTKPIADGGLNIAKNAQVNKIEEIALPGAVLDIANKRVDIPRATVEKYGVFKSAEENSANLVHVRDDGIGEVKYVSTDSLIQGTAELVLNGGNA